MREFCTSVFRKYILHDVWRKLIALFLALVVWTVLHNELTQQHTFPVTVPLRHSDRFVIISESRMPDLEITVERVSSEVSDQPWGDYSRYGFYVELPDRLPKARGDWTFTVNDLRHDKLPEGVVVKAMFPPAVTVEYDVLKRKEVPVMLPSDIVLDERILKFSDLEPPTAVLIGPSSYLQNRHSIPLKRFHHRDYLQKPTERVELHVDNPLSMVTVEPSRVSVRVRDVKIREIKELTLRKRLIAVGGEGNGVQIAGELPDVTVRISGTKEHLSTLSEEDVFCFVSLRGVTAAGERRLPVLVGGVPNDLDYKLQEETVPVTLVLPNALAAGEEPPAQETENTSEVK